MELGAGKKKVKTVPVVGIKLKIGAGFIVNMGDSDRGEIAGTSAVWG